MEAITNLGFVPNIDDLAAKEEGLASLVDRLEKNSTAFDIEISAGKTQRMTNNTNDISIDVRNNGEKLDEVDSFKNLAAIITDQGSKPEVLSRTCTDNSSTARLKTIWNGSKLKDQT